MAQIEIQGVMYHVSNVLRCTPALTSAICRAVGPHPWPCTRSLGHAGLHICSTQTRVFAMWGTPDCPSVSIHAGIEINGVQYRTGEESLYGPRHPSAGQHCRAVRTIAGRVGSWHCSLLPGHCALTVHIACWSDGRVGAIWGSPVPHLIEGRR